MENYVFNFPDQRALSIQCDETCKAIYQDVYLCLQSVADSSLSKMLSDVKDMYHVHWLARYASVIMHTSINDETSIVTLIGLDHWERKVHASTTGREDSSFADVTKSQTFSIGHVPTKEIDKYLDEFHKKLSESEANTGSNRRQSSGNPGNQKTPSFACYMLRQVICESQEVLPIYGGTTDVGRHTGCLSRNTSFPLVQSAICKMLQFNGEETDQKFNQCIVLYFCVYLTSIVAKIKSYIPNEVNRAVTVIREIEGWMEKIEDIEFKKKILLKLEDEQSHLEQLRPTLNEDITTVPSDSISDLLQKLHSPSFPTIPDISQGMNCTTRLDRARLDALQNLNISNISTYHFTGKTQDAWVVLHKLNDFFWNISGELDGTKDSFYDITDLRTKLDHYNKATKVAKMVADRNPHIMSVVLSSCEVLAVWICFCWAHLVAETKHQHFRGTYAPALNASDLYHLSLHDARAIKAVDNIRDFLKLRSSPSKKKPFRNEADTFTLALNFGQRSTTFQHIYQTELDDANRQIEERYKIILTKQNALRRLDNELCQAECELDSANRAKARSTVYTRYGSIDTCDPTYRAARSRVRQCKEEVSRIKGQISLHERKPKNLNFPLPRQRDCALRWLFFLYMPNEFRDLSALAQSGQSKLWKSVPTSMAGATDLRNWFLSHKTVSNSPSPVDKMILRSSKTIPYSRTPGIRQYYKETGVFFPDSLIPEARWISTDPFAPGRKKDDTTKLFTEILPITHQRDFMQQFIPMLPTHERGNLAIAKRHQKPDWLTAESYFTYATLRAFPTLQIRELVRSLVEDLLPFEHECVHVLVKQLLFQIGESSWKADLFEAPWEGMNRMAEQLQIKAEILRQSPRDRKKLVLFGVVSSFLGQYSDENLECARNFAKIARKWGDDINSEVASAEHVPPDVYWKEAECYGYGLLCHLSGERDYGDHLEMAELIVLFTQKILFTSSIPQADLLKHAILQMMASRIEDIIFYIEKDLSHLTKCLSLVLDAIPSDLKWKPVVCDNAGNSGCFEAISGHLYSLNLLNGTVLVDGVPPGFLPHSVVDDPLYKRTFGSRNFETVVLGFRHYRTSRFVDEDRLYEFLYDSRGELQILECRVNQPKFKMHLLRKESIDLPVLLREKYSHWHVENGDLVVLRGPSYHDKRIEYVITSKGTYIIPFKLQDSSLVDIKSQLGNCDKLMLGETNVCKVLGRFESNEYIHIYINPECTELRYSLSRCKLEFVQRDKKVFSTEFTGFTLRSNQTLENTLLAVTSYLVLENSKGYEKVLSPSGSVQNMGAVSIPLDWDTEFHYYTYDVHGRFGSLIAKTRESRLHLAAMYASSSSYLAEKRLIKPGFIVAVDLVRQCWTNEMLSDIERLKLNEVSRHSNLSCTLRLICSWIWFSSNAVYFLYGQDEKCKIKSLDLDLLAVDEYRQNSYAPRLLPSEELHLLGTKRIIACTPPFQHSENKLTNNSKVVFEVETLLHDTYLETEQQIKLKKTFPLIRPHDCHGLSSNVFDDLECSWDMYCGLERKKIRFRQSWVTTLKCRWKEFCASECKRENVGRELWCGTLKVIRELRNQAESLLLEKLSTYDSIEYRMSQISGKRLIASPLDLMCIAWDESKILSFNPFLAACSRMDLREESIDWMMLCVLEDKLDRMMNTNDSKKLETELDCVREWDPYKHPRWLAFEVEQRIQIRPYQFSIVDQLLKKPGTCTQLNMGLGKTRVLLPMLILELAQLRSSVVRVTTLASIFHEAIEYFREVLVASVQHVRVFSLPFHRDNPLDAKYQHQRALTREIVKCRGFMGCIMTTPQHRNSLLLKQYDNEVFVDGLKENFKDILDESDALLDHDFQLVYAIGNQAPLPEGPSRWNMFQAFLTRLARDECYENSGTSSWLRIFARDGCHETSAILSDRRMVHRESASFGCFPKLRLLSPFKEFESKVGPELCRQLIKNPPYGLRWMKKVWSNPDRIDLLVSIISRRDFTDVISIIRTDSLLKEHESDILIARGCIAYGMLFHGLHRRHRVDYGIDKRSRRQLAVPFAASETPKPRAEYSHPDMAILYTCLSYYQEGLDECQFKDSLMCLQRLGRTAQVAVYKEWIESIRKDADPEELSSFDHIFKVDVDSQCLLELMHVNLGKSMEVISFWMNNFVFPEATHQFPARRVTNAWNLVDSGQAVGFSGTDDTRFLLPLSIKQEPPNDPTLRSTNGEMIDRILKCTNEIRLLDDGTDECPLWKVVVNQSLSLGTSALIDVSGLMAGSANKEVAEFAVSQPSRRDFRGVVYFDVELMAWTVYESENKRHLPLHTSSLPEAECFVYFDESRCRGSDMKLRDDAIALVTLEPKLRKDKFLQGCMRMRNLRPNGQSLILAGTTESLTKDMKIEAVLDKILRNTIDMIEEGVLTYFERGMTSFSFPTEIKENVMLEGMYATKMNEHKDLAAYLDATYELESLPQKSKELVQYCTGISEGVDVNVSRLAEECEQEVEKEIEEEEMEEIELVTKQPYFEEDWMYEIAFSNPTSLFNVLFVCVKDQIKNFAPELSKIKWSEKLFCTPNFWKTIRDAKMYENTTSYLRPVNSMLCLTDGRVVLISEYEANKLMPYWRRVKNPKAILHHLSMVVTGNGFGKDNNGIFDVKVLTSIKLFRGCVEFQEEEKKVLDDMFKSIRALPFIQTLLVIRDRIRYFDRSDLDDIAVKYVE